MDYVDNKVNLMHSITFQDTFISMVGHLFYWYMLKFTMCCSAYILVAIENTLLNVYIFISTLEFQKYSLKRPRLWNYNEFGWWWGQTEFNANRSFIMNGLKTLNASKSNFPCALYFVQLFADDLVLYHLISHCWLEMGKPICECAMCDIINKSYY